MCVRERGETLPNTRPEGIRRYNMYSGEGVVASVSNQPTTILYGGAGGRRPGAVVAVEYCHCEFIEALSSIIYTYTICTWRYQYNADVHCALGKSIRFILWIFTHCPNYIRHWYPMSSPYTLAIVIFVQERFLRSTNLFVIFTHSIFNKRIAAGCSRYTYV